jgi:hypothetical protein
MDFLSAASAGTRAVSVSGAAGRTDAVEQKGQMSAADLWTYRSTLAAAELTGYRVEAVDGSIGKVDEASTEVGSSYLIVDTGPWIFGKKVLLPAGVIDRVDTADEIVYVDRTKDEIKAAPEFDEARYRDAEYRDKVGEYYSRGHIEPL